MKTYSINFKVSRTEHGETYFRSGNLGTLNGRQIRLAIYPRTDADGWKVVLQGKDYSAPLAEDEDPVTQEDCVDLALTWYQGFRRSKAHVSA